MLRIINIHLSYYTTHEITGQEKRTIPLIPGRLARQSCGEVGLQKKIGGDSDGYGKIITGKHPEPQVHLQPSKIA